MAQPWKIRLGIVLLVAEQQAVARLPHRRGDDVAEPHAALALAGEVEADALLVLLARPRQHRQRAAELVAQPRVVDRERGDGIDWHALEAGAGEQRQKRLVDLHLPLADALGFDADDGAAGVVVEGDFGALELGEEVGERRVAGEVDLEGAELSLDGVVAGVGDGLDEPAVEVLQDQAFEQIVDLVGLEAQGGGGVAVDGAVVLEVGHAAGEHGHALDRQVGRGRLGGGGLGFLCHESRRVEEAGGQHRGRAEGFGR